MSLQSLAIALMVMANTQPDSTASMNTAPPASPESRYCMRIEAATGSRIEAVECWTRDEWAYQGVDIDHDWARNGVRVLA